MNLQAILNPLDTYFYNESEDDSAFQHVAQDVSYRFFSEMHVLYQSVARYFPPRLFRSCVTEKVDRVPSIVDVAHSRLRPSRDYYEKLRIPLPWPDNPDGYDAAGLELRVWVRNGNIALDAIYHPAVIIEYNIWGEHERKAFGKMLSDHRRLIESLLSINSIEFFTSGVFENLENYKGDKILRKLDLYFENTDDENSFIFYVPFTGSGAPAEFHDAYYRLLILFDGCLGYAERSKDRDRLLDYYRRFPGWRFDDITNMLS